MGNDWKCRRVVITQMLWAEKRHFGTIVRGDSSDFLRICAHDNLIKNPAIYGVFNRIGDDWFAAKRLNVFVWDSLRASSRWDYDTIHLKGPHALYPITYRIFATRLADRSHRAIGDFGIGEIATLHGVVFFHIVGTHHATDL